MDFDMEAMGDKQFEELHENDENRENVNVLVD